MLIKSENNLKRKFSKKHFGRYNHEITFQDSISTFSELENRCWSGAEDTLKDVAEAGKEEELMDLLAENSWDTFGQINDYLWFNRDDIYRTLEMLENEDLDEAKELLEKYADHYNKDWTVDEKDEETELGEAIDIANTAYDELKSVIEDAEDDPDYDLRDYINDLEEAVKELKKVGGSSYVD